MQFYFDRDQMELGGAIARELTRTVKAEALRPFGNALMPTCFIAMHHNDNGISTPWMQVPLQDCSIPGVLIVDRRPGKMGRLERQLGPKCIWMVLSRQSNGRYSRQHTITSVRRLYLFVSLLLSSKTPVVLLDGYWLCY